MAFENVRAIRLPLIDENAMFNVMRSKIQLLQIKGLFRGLVHDDAHDYIQNFLDMCIPFSLKNISRE